MYNRTETVELFKFELSFFLIKKETKKSRLHKTLETIKGSLHYILGNIVTNQDY